MNKRKIIISILLFLFVVNGLFSQQKLRVGFYNLENFFDVFTDSLSDYNDFTPQGNQHWDYNRFQTKRNNTFKTILAMGEGEPPALLGFCEVENEVVLRELIYKTPLKSFDYQYINYPSPDRRGIDVALIYRKQLLTLLESRVIRINDPHDPGFKTRDILFASFLSGKDTIRFFINHWPSRYSGTLATFEKRVLVAGILKHQTDSILLQNPHSKIVIMGDFNDCAEDISMRETLKALPIGSDCIEYCLFNLFNQNSELGFEGTLKHEQQWQIFDQIIVSGFLLSDTLGLHYVNESARIFAPKFLLTQDEKYSGTKTYRTYMGPKYIGGYSDHLPVYIDLIGNLTPPK